MTSVRNGLQWKVLTGLAILTVVTVGSQIWNNSLYRTSVARYTVLGEVRQLETVGEALLGRGQHYINNAARDYESYARDVALFKRELLGDAVTHIAAAHDGDLLDAFRPKDHPHGQTQAGPNPV